MRVFVYVTLIFPLTAAPLARLALTRLHPRHATWLLSLAAVILAGTSCGALGLVAISALVRIPALAHLAHLSHRVIIAGGDSTSGVIAVAAGILFGAALLLTATFTVTRARTLAAAFTHARALPGAASLVITRDESADAYTVPGNPGRIVVSTGMLEALDRPGRRALLAHEHAHLDHRHYLYTTAARLAAAANPLVRPLAGAVDYAVERWADEHAAHTIGDRRQVATAIATAAIATKHARPRRSPALALGAVVSRTSGLRLDNAGPVPRRVAALLDPAPRTSLPALAAGLAVLVLAAFCALEAANDLQDLLSLAHWYADHH
ncbi:M48 family metalloprotease [Actinospica sp. MGRD01-02]|uniref:M48 family metalloprotease n=1 Tax=Actinospica acidithermotolerans TaxID=2828514 RepID=A0A941EHQ7_9ACTN|nr:M48 family metalloprotease [Actinospica acidithermotolerans]MBR7830722.1 M48 family metalloprotease [Actinospica acidithermotolerans]